MREQLYPAIINTKFGSLYGYINDFGTFVILPSFTTAYDFSDSCTAIVSNEHFKYGIINESGTYILKPVFDTLTPFKEHRSIYSKDSEIGVIDENGTILTKKDYSYISEYENEFAIISYIQNNTTLYGYLNIDGEEQIPANFMEAEPFNMNKTALVKIRDHLYSLINDKGDILQTYPFSVVTSYGDGLFMFSDNQGTTFGYINTQGHIIIPPKFTSASAFNDNVAIVSESPNFPFQYGVIDNQGNYIYPPVYSTILPLNSDRLALGKPMIPGNAFRNIFALSDTHGTIYTTFKFRQLNKYENNVAAVSDNEFSYFVNMKGNLEKKLPIVKGSGELTLLHGIVYAFIDYIPFYLKKSGIIIYEPNTLIKLNLKYSIKKEKYKPNFNYLIYYPCIDGVSNKEIEKQINLKLAQLSYFLPPDENGKPQYRQITSYEILSFDYLGTFEIIFFYKNMLVLKLYGYYYPLGAAHGISEKLTPCINLRTGTFYQLHDLFIPNSNWIEYLNNIINDMIKNDPSYRDVFPEVDVKIRENHPFFIDKENLYLYFSEGEIAPHSSGFVTFKIPFQNLESILDFENDFFKAFLLLS